MQHQEEFLKTLQCGIHRFVPRVMLSENNKNLVCTF